MSQKVISVMAAIATVFCLSVPALAGKIRRLNPQRSDKARSHRTDNLRL